MSATYGNAALQITVEGAALDPALARRAASVLVRQRLSAPSLAEVAFAEPPADSLSVFRFGAALRIETADDGQLFDGEVTAIDYERDGAEGRVVRVRAYDRLHRLRKRQRARIAANTTLGQFVSDTLAEAGLSLVDGGGGAAQRLIAQYEENDLDLIVRLAAQSGLYLLLDGDEARLVSLAGEGSAVELKLGRDLVAARASANAESMRSGTSAKAWNVLRNSVVSASAQSPRQGGPHPLDLAAFDGLGARTLFNRLAAVEDEAQALAQADLDRSAARAVTLEASAAGNPNIRPGGLVQVSGLGDPIDGAFTVTEAVHAVTADEGYLTRFSTEPPTIIQTSPARPTFTFGVVSDVGDPDRLARVKAHLPLLGDIETDWMPVVTPGAGPEKGLAVMPEPQDDVLILFPQGDIAFGVVLGGLYGERQSPGQTTTGVRPFAFRTGNGQAITLDAAKALVRLETSGGDVFETGPDGTKLHATRDLVIEAPGQTITIRAKAIEFEQG